MPIKVAKNSDWKTNPLPENRVRLTFDRVFSAEETKLIKTGLLPREMEDKWFIYFENDMLFFHRSWTGNCIYQLHFAQEENGLRALYVEVNRDPEQHRQENDESDLWLINRLIDSQLLRKP